ncbi:unnamed protein product, partial [Gadus morhua 'NCC']
MYLEGLEMIGVLVVVVVFVKVLEHFGWLGAGYDVADNCNAASGTPGDATIVTATTGSITLSAVSASLRPCGLIVQRLEDGRGRDPRRQAEGPGALEGASSSSSWRRSRRATGVGRRRRGQRRPGRAPAAAAAVAAGGRGGGMATEGLQTVGIVVLVCASIKLLHLLGIIDFSEGSVSSRGGPELGERARLARLLPGVAAEEPPANSVEDELEQSAVRHRPEGLEQLEAQTRFSRKELQILYRGFKNECPSGVVNEDTFKDIYSQFFPQG